ncbi:MULTISPECIES: hypothetical protein [unclassified Acidovorax]|uniref:hypothetical protein n=1 Tax=unclassified Acidovorax TaxID=2684926 RepID=UPI00145CE02E|nr:MULTISPECIES: hypothetical protein [unclassified Acidovorax]
MENLELLKKLQELGVAFCVSVPSQWGQETHIAKPEELLALIEDPTVVFAAHYGVSKSEYLAWANEDFSVHCSGKTSKGKQCKNIVPGGSNVSPSTWVELQGEYCTVHSVGREI